MYKEVHAVFCRESGQGFGAEAVFLGKVKDHFTALFVNPGDAQLFRHGTDSGYGNQIHGIPRNFAKAVDQFIDDFFLVGGRGCSGDLLVHLQFQHFIRDIPIRNQSRYIQFNRRFFPIRVDHFSAQRPHRIVHQLAVQLITDVHHVAVLFGSQEISRASNLQIPHGHFEAGAELCKFFDRPQTLFRHFRKALILLKHQVGICHAVGAAHPSPELIKLGEAETIRIQDEHGIHVGNVNARFNDRRCHQHVGLALNKSHDHIFQVMLVHLPVSHGYLCLGHQFLNMGGQLVDALDPVKDDIYLSAPVQFFFNSVPDQHVVLLQNVGLNRIPLFRRFFNDAHILDAYQRHVKSSGDRGR